MGRPKSLPSIDKINLRCYLRVMDVVLEYARGDDGMYSVEQEENEYILADMDMLGFAQWLGRKVDELRSRGVDEF